MKLIYLIAIVSCLLVGCAKEEPVNADCIESVLINHQMVAYTGQQIDCSFFLELYQYGNKQWFLLGNHCADMISYPFDCDGNLLCDDEASFRCEDFHENAERLRIVGISN